MIISGTYFSVKSRTIPCAVILTLKKEAVRKNYLTKVTIAHSAVSCAALKRVRTNL